MKYLCTVVVLGILFWGETPPLYAQSTAVEVRIDIILASRSGDQLSGELSAQAGRLRAQFGQFSSFRFVHRHSFQLSTGQRRTVALPQSAGTATVSFLGTTSRGHRLEIQIPGGSTTVQSPQNGLFFVGGPSTAGGTVILMIQTR